MGKKLKLNGLNVQLPDLTPVPVAGPDPGSRFPRSSFQLSALLKTEAAKSRKQRRTLKQIHEDLKELGFEGSYDIGGAAFARVWREGQT